jgi:hypothetical protein
MIPRFDGAILSHDWKNAIWARFVTQAPRPRTPSELQYNDHNQLRTHLADFMAAYSFAWQLGLGVLGQD